MIILVVCVKFGVSLVVSKDISFMSVLKNFKVRMRTFGVKFVTVEHIQLMIALKREQEKIIVKMGRNKLGNHTEL